LSRYYIVILQLFVHRIKKKKNVYDLFSKDKKIYILQILLLIIDFVKPWIILNTKLILDYIWVVRKEIGRRK